MGFRFNPPPGWPAPPSGWTPGPGWQPDSSWPPPPPGWVLWIDDSSTPAPSPAPAGFVDRVMAVPSSRKSGLGGLLGKSRKSAQEENAYLKSVLDASGALPATQLATETAALQERLGQLRVELRQAEHDLAQARSELVETNEIAQLQEAGIYQYAHPLSDAVGYKDLLDRVRRDTKAMITDADAVTASTTWQVNGSVAEGRKMVRDFSKVLLRAYNAEADNCVRTVKPHRRRACLDRLCKAEATIQRLGRTMSIAITEQYHRLRLYEIELTADYLAKVEQERDRTRAERERMRDEAAAAREMEREKARLAKEQAHYANALSKALAGQRTSESVAELQAKLAEIDSEIRKVISREANIRAGWVYVISNIGAFGENMVKIGLTRRLEPMDRVRELGDASVPFRFDVHALIFSEDAVTLESQLHQRLAERKVNQVNNAREFFYATPADVKDVLADIAGQHLLEYREEPQATEWRASGSRRANDVLPPTHAEQAA